MSLGFANIYDPFPHLNALSNIVTKSLIPSPYFRDVILYERPLSG